MVIAVAEMAETGNDCTTAIWWLPLALRATRGEMVVSRGGESVHASIIALFISCEIGNNICVISGLFPWWLTLFYYS